MGFLNTLKKITLGSGYWVNMKEDKILTISGSMPKEITINLNKGWNLIGYPDVKSNSPEGSRTSGSTLVAVYDGTSL